MMTPPIAEYTSAQRDNIYILAGLLRVMLKGKKYDDKIALAAEILYSLEAFSLAKFPSMRFYNSVLCAGCDREYHHHEIERAMN